MSFSHKGSLRDERSLRKTEPQSGRPNYGAGPTTGQALLRGRQAEKSLKRISANKQSLERIIQE